MKEIRKLENLGYKVTLESREILLKYLGDGEPEPEEVRPLLEEVKRRKDEAVNYLFYRDNPGASLEKEASVAEESINGRDVIKKESKVFGDIVFCAKDQHEAKKAPSGSAVYTLKELRCLLDMKDNPAGLRRIHETKKVFPGSKIVNLN